MSKLLRAGLLAGIVMAFAGSSGFAIDPRDIDKAIAAERQAAACALPQRTGSASRWIFCHQAGD